MKIVNTLPKELKNDALEIYYEAFNKKEQYKILSYSKKQAIKLYKKGINFKSGLYAIKKNKVIGVLGFKSSKRQLIKYKLNILTKEFGFFGGLFRKIRYLFTQIENISKKDIKIEAIAVDKKYRNKKIGTKLIKKAIEFAKSKKYKRIILNVVNTNPNAKRFYLRLGFKVINDRYYGFITKKAGYTSISKMAYYLD
jgi:GNAT superfamily N-acetyltransferase